MTLFCGSWGAFWQHAIFLFRCRDSKSLNTGPLFFLWLGGVEVRLRKLVVADRI